MASKKKDEEVFYVLPPTLDACLADGVIKTGASVVLGGLASILFFKRRRWPIIAGVGMGVGLAWANCENTLNNDLKKKA